MIIPGLYNYCYIKYITIHELINLKISGKGHGVCKHWQVKVIGSGKQGAHCGRTDLAILKTNSKQQWVVGNLWHVFSVHKIFQKIFQKMEARGWSGTSVLRARRSLGSNYPPQDCTFGILQEFQASSLWRATRVRRICRPGWRFCLCGCLVEWQTTYRPVNSDAWCLAGRCMIHLVPFELNCARYTTFWMIQITSDDFWFGQEFEWLPAPKIGSTTSNLKESSPFNDFCTSLDKKVEAGKTLWGQSCKLIWPKKWRCVWNLKKKDGLLIII